MCGFVFYLAIGAKTIDYNIQHQEADQDVVAGKVTGSMSVICSSTYLIDSVFSIIKIITRLTKD